MAADGLVDFSFFSRQVGTEPGPAADVDEVREPIHRDKPRFPAKELAVYNIALTDDGTFPFPYALTLFGEPTTLVRHFLDGKPLHLVPEKRQEPELADGVEQGLVTVYFVHHAFSFLIKNDPSLILISFLYRFLKSQWVSVAIPYQMNIDIIRMDAIYNLRVIFANASIFNRHRTQRLFPYT